MGHGEDWVRSKAVHHPLHIPRGALYRVVWVDNDNPSRRLVSLFNPDKLMMTGGASYGSLMPIGWSREHEQYVGARSKRYNLTLAFSAIGHYERDFGNLSTVRADSFFSSFVHAKDVGHRPPLLKMVWPNMAVMLFNLHDYSVEYRDWNVALELKNYAVTLDLTLVERKFVTTSDAATAHMTSFPSDDQNSRVGVPIAIGGSLAKWK